VIVFPNCKINLGLHVLGKQPDGYHALDTVFYPLPLTDALELIPASEFRFSSSGIELPGASEDNLVCRAWRLLHHRFPSLSAYHVHLHKIIPTGAGLGGGSSDGSFMLAALNKLAALGLSEKELRVMALELGSDCPFFIVNKPSAAKGRGEQLQPLSLELSMYRFVVIHPGIHVSTREAFTNITPDAGRTSPSQTVLLPIQEWKHALVNDFEKTVGSHYPEIMKAKQCLYDAGALYAAMSGSGAAVFGIFAHKPEMPLLPASWKLFYI
jgi:4-diphosphocytidyl-2-C-methyl-D-erythritol kinase